MGAVTGMLGLGGGQSGTGVAKPSGVNLPGLVTEDQLRNGYANVDAGMEKQNQLLNALNAQNGIQNQSQVYGQLQGVANGTGPNPAQAQYQQNVQDLARQQSGAISSIKGISPALAATMISQQGSAAMQNAAAAGGANLANQQLGAMSAAGNMANVQAGNQIGQTNTNASTALSEQQALLTALGQQNSTNVNMQSNINSANAGMAGQAMQNQKDPIGGLFNSAGAIGKTALGSATGIKFAGGGSVGSPPPGPQSQLGQFLHQRMASGGEVQALVSPGELYLPPGKVNEVLKGKSPLDVGKVFPGKPKVAGNSYANDTLPRKLQVGGVVIPNNIMQSANPAKGASDMVQRIIAKKKARG